MRGLDVIHENSRTLEEVIVRANARPFGLTGYLFSRNFRIATLAAEALEVGDQRGCYRFSGGGAVRRKQGKWQKGYEGGSLGITMILKPSSSRCA